ncbi:MAG: hypothetical protein ACREN2_13315 [Candidatus Dormibacteria bacterium]
MSLLRNRVVLATGVVAAVLAVVIALHASSQAPGSASLAWGPAPSPSTSALASPTVGMPIAPATPAPASLSPLGGLQLPLSALFTQLNSETRNSALGQYSILQEIGDAIREHISQFLTSVTGGR